MATEGRGPEWADGKGDSDGDGRGVSSRESDGLVLVLVFRLVEEVVGKSFGANVGFDGVECLFLRSG